MSGPGYRPPAHVRSDHCSALGYGRSSAALLCGSVSVSANAPWHTPKSPLKTREGPAERTSNYLTLCECGPVVQPAQAGRSTLR